MKIVYNRLLPFGKKFAAINLCGVLFAKVPIDARILNHESIHTSQIKELVYIFFYLFYVVEWLIRFIQYGDHYKAYFNISFEREAYYNESNFSYLKKRKPYSFIKYLKRGKGESTN